MEIVLFVGCIVLMLIDVKPTSWLRNRLPLDYNHCIAINCRFLVFRVEGDVDVFSLEKSLKELLSELRQTQTPLAFESDTTDNLMGRLDP